jgi:glutathione reductase (NADPH)
MGTGRVPEIDDLDLNLAGVQWDQHRDVRVNEYLQSVSNSAVYAAGDAAASGGPPLTTVESTTGVLFAANLLEGESHEAQLHWSSRRTPGRNACSPSSCW